MFFFERSNITNLCFMPVSFHLFTLFNGNTDLFILKLRTLKMPRSPRMGIFDGMKTATFLAVGHVFAWQGGITFGRSRLCGYLSQRYTASNVFNGEGWV